MNRSALAATAVAAAVSLTPWSSAFASRMRPRPTLTMSAWADRYRVVPPGTSPEPGPWRTERAPYLREILDAASDPTVQRVTIQAASQVGKSEILLSAIGYYAHQDPSPILLVQATEEAAKGFSKERVAPMFEASSALQGLLAPELRSPTNTTMLRQFPGGLLACAWSGSAASLASRPIRVVLGDELDRWTDSTGRDGDPWAQAVQRAANFFNRKIVAVSTPTDEGFSAIARLYEDSDQRRYHVPCPRCGVLQALQWSGVVYKDLADAVDLDGISYRCVHCGGRIEEREKPAMLAEGMWVADNPGHPHRGYQISAIYSPWVRWRELAEKWIKANADRDHRGLKEFVNLSLGETWQEDTERITVEGLEKNREHYLAEVPHGVLFLTCGVDVQDNRLELEVRGWGEGKESWGIEYAILPGDTSLAPVWALLDQHLQRPRLRADGRGVTISCTCIDSGGHRTDEVYAFTRDRLVRNVFAIKGGAGSGKPIAGKPSIVQRTLLYHLGVDGAKETIFSRLALAEPGPGYMHWPIGKGYDDEYFKGLLSETRRRKMVDGRPRLVWVQLRPRNEPLDCAVYATAAMEIILPTLDLKALAEAEAAAQAGVVPMAPRAKRRRIFSRGIE